MKFNKHEKLVKNKNLRLPDISFEGPAENRPSEDPSLNTFTTVIIIIIFIVIVIIIIIIIIIVIINSIFLVIITCCFRTIQGKSERNSKLENENEVLIIKFK